jgi:hypothetical protein
VGVSPNIGVVKSPSRLREGLGEGRAERVPSWLRHLPSPDPSRLREGRCMLANGCAPAGGRGDACWLTDALPQAGGEENDV